MERLISQVYAGVVTYDEDKKKWMPAGSAYGISNIEILQNEDSNGFRIVGWHLHSREMILNCTITRHFKYNQATATFHQWRDRNHIYGLNFPSSEESEKFASSLQNILSTRHHSSRSQHVHSSSSTSSSPRLSLDTANSINSRKVESPKAPFSSSSSSSVPTLPGISSKIEITPQRILTHVPDGNNEHVNTNNEQFSDVIMDIAPQTTRSTSQSPIGPQSPSTKVIPTPPPDPPVVSHVIPPPPPLPEVNKPNNVNSTLENQLKQAKLKNAANPSSCAAAKYPKPAASGDFLAELQMALSQSLQSSGKIRIPRRMSSDGFDKQRDQSEVAQEGNQISSSGPKRIGLSNTTVRPPGSQRPPSSHTYDSRSAVQRSVPTRMHPDDLQSLKQELLTELRQEIHKAKDEVIDVIRQTMNKS